MSYIEEFLIFILLFIGSFGWGVIVVNLFNRIFKLLHLEELTFYDFGEEIYFLISFGIGFVSILFFFLGAVKLYYSYAALFVFTLGFICTVPKLITCIYKIKSLSFKVKFDWPIYTIVFISIVSGLSNLLYIFVVNTMVPPFEWDEIAYHLAVPKIYIANHGFVYIPSILQSNWPMAVQMLFTGSLLLGGELATHMVTFSMAALAGVGIILLVRRFANYKAGWIAAALFLNIPLIWRLSGTGLIDIALAFFLIPILISLVSFQKTKQMAWLFTCGVMCGYAASIKQTGIILAAIIGILILFRFGQDSISVPKKILYVSILGSTAFVVALPWFIKSTVFTNDPLFPFLYRIFGGKNWDQTGSIYFQLVWQMIYEELPRNFSGLLTSIDYLFFNPQKLGGYWGGIGIIPLSFFILGIVFAIAFRKNTPLEIYQLIFLTVLFYLFWFLFASLEIRYLTPIYVPIAIIAGFSLEALISKIAVLSQNRALQTVFVFFAIISFSFLLLKDTLLFSPSRMAMFHDRARVVFRRIPKQDFLNTRINALAAFRYINQNLPSDAVVLLTPYENRGYYLDRPYIWAHPANQRYIRFEEFSKTDKLAAYLQELHVSYILDNPNVSFTGYKNWQHDRQLMIDLQKECGEEIFQQNKVVIYKLKPCKK